MAADDDDVRVYKALAVVGVLFFAATLKSWQEFRYMVSGQQAQATVTKVVEDRNRRGGANGYRLYYNFFNKNTDSPAHHNTLIPVDAVDLFPVGQEITIDYYGEKYPTTRLHGTTHRGWVYLFFGSLALLGGIVAFMSIRSAREDKRPVVKRKR